MEVDDWWSTTTTTKSKIHHPPPLICTHPQSGEALKCFLEHRLRRAAPLSPKPSVHHLLYWTPVQWRSLTLGPSLSSLCRHPFAMPACVLFFLFIPKRLVEGMICCITVLLGGEKAAVRILCGAAHSCIFFHIFFYVATWAQLQPFAVKAVDYRPENHRRRSIFTFPHVSHNDTHTLPYAGKIIRTVIPPDKGL